MRATDEQINDYINRNFPDIRGCLICVPSNWEITEKDMRCLAYYIKNLIKDNPSEYLDKCEHCIGDKVTDKSICKQNGRSVYNPDSYFNKQRKDDEPITVTSAWRFNDAIHRLGAFTGIDLYINNSESVEAHTVELQEIIKHGGI